MRYDIRRTIRELDTVMGGTTLTSTAIETREIDMQHLRGEEVLGLGGLRIEANFKGYCHENTNIREQDYISPDSGTTRYQIVFVQNLWGEHIKFFAKKVQ